MTVEEAKSIIDAYAKIRQEEKEISLPVKVSWIRRQNLQKLMNVFSLYNEALTEIQLRYADDEHSVLNEDGTRQVKDQYINQYQKECIELYQQDADVDIKKVKLEDLGDLTLTESQMDTLGFMIEE